jgi:hypothetical protein
MIPLVPNGATLKQVNAALKAKGVAERLARGRGGYYFREGDAMSWPSSSVYVNHVSAFTVEGWLKEYEELKKGAE